MRLVIADNGPVNYLILIGHIDILPALFEKVILPAIVRDELKHPKAPPAVQRWTADLPSWAEVRHTVHVFDVSRGASLEALDAGEEEAIALAVERSWINCSPTLPGGSSGFLRYLRRAWAAGSGIPSGHFFRKIFVSTPSFIWLAG